MTIRPLRRRVLYVSYDGVLEPLGESQVVAYLERLADRAAITLLSFEKPVDLADGARVAAMGQRLEDAGISWIARRYHKRPPILSTACDIVAGAMVARRWAKDAAPGTEDATPGPEDAAPGTEDAAPGTRHPAQHPAPGTWHPAPGVVHARSYVPALIAWRAKRAFGAQFLFDMRGFWVDEKVEAGHWRAGGVLYRVGKWCERRFVENADAVVSLTSASVRELPALGRVREGVRVVVIPTCADLDRFAPGPSDAALRAALGLDGALVVGSVGTLSNWYLRDETLAYLAWMVGRFDRMKVLFVTREDHDRLRQDAARAGLPLDRVALTRSTFDEMPALMRMMDAGVFFIRVCFSKRASAATKLAEFLGCGIPVIINDGIGDSGTIVRRDRVGVVLPRASADAFGASESEVRALLGDSGVRERCRQTALREFSLTRGVEQYAELYRQLT